MYTTAVGGLQGEIEPISWSEAEGAGAVQGTPCAGRGGRAGRRRRRW